MSKTKTIALGCALFIGAVALFDAAHGQVINPGVQQAGVATVGNCTKWGPGTGQIQDAGTPCGTATGASPTATATTVAVPGSAATFMRSDGAPAVATTTFGGQAVGPGGTAAVQGNGAKIQLSTGTTTTGHCADFDLNGNVIDAGAACGGASGANPTATATTSAVPGIATTFMRSDGAPAVATTTFGGQSVGPGGSATVQGNGAKIQLATGTTATGHCADFDLNGNVIDAGGNCVTSVSAGNGLTGGGSGTPSIALALNNATLQASPANPATLISGSFLMEGLGTTCHITPVYSGRVQVSFNFDLESGTTSVPLTSKVMFGTGTAPANAAAVTGTQVGNTHQILMANGGDNEAITHGAYIITGLAVGTAIWLDIAAMGDGTHGLAMFNPSCSAMEF